MFNLITSDLTNTGNVIEGVGSSQQVFQDAALGGSDWTSFQTTLSSNNRCVVECQQLDYPV